MKIILALLVVSLACFSENSKQPGYHGSTTPNPEVREFLGISLTDSIDFIRWNLVIHPGRYELDCRYGLSKANTDGFSNEKKTAFSGALAKQGTTYLLKQGNRTLHLQEINSHLLHLADANNKLLVGNGGFSCALNSKSPVKSTEFNYPVKPVTPKRLMVFQGRTPCLEIAGELGQQRDKACYKKKWYVVLVTDSTTGKPDYYLEGGLGYKKMTMTKGKWDILNKNGRTIYKLEVSTRPLPIYLLRADENILFFTDANGNLLVGDDDFSYTLNRTVDREPIVSN
jgi:hypothetical protein